MTDEQNWIDGAKQIAEGGWTIAEIAEGARRFAHAGHDLIDMEGDPTFCVTCGFDVMGPNECQTGSAP